MRQFSFFFILFLEKALCSQFWWGPSQFLQFGGPLILTLSHSDTIPLSVCSTVTVTWAGCGTWLLCWLSPARLASTLLHIHTIIDCHTVTHSYYQWLSNWQTLTLSLTVTHSHIYTIIDCQTVTYSQLSLTVSLAHIHTIIDCHTAHYVFRSIVALHR